MNAKVCISRKYGKCFGDYFTSDLNVFFLVFISFSILITLITFLTICFTIKYNSIFRDVTFFVRKRHHSEAHQKYKKTEHF